jgi:hypothetical protein
MIERSKANLTKKCKDLGEIFPEENKPTNITLEKEKAIVDVLKTVGNIWNGVGEAVVTAASIGAITGGVAALGQAR